MWRPHRSGRRPPALAPMAIVNDMSIMISMLRKISSPPSQAPPPQLLSLFPAPTWSPPWAPPVQIRTFLDRKDLHSPEIKGFWWRALPVGAIRGDGTAWKQQKDQINNQQRHFALASAASIAKYTLFGMGLSSG